MGRLRRQDDRLARPDHGVCELPEEQRLRGRVEPALADVVHVVQPDADDLHLPIFAE